MDGRSWIVHLLGFPAVGKRTVAVALVAASEAATGRRFVLLDNHLTGNPILAVLDRGGAGTVAQEVWDLVGEVRDVQDRAILRLAPPDRSFVFTNAAMAGDDNGIRAVARLQRLAAARGSAYVPVVLRCDPAELLERVPNADRAAHGKWVVPAEVAAHVAGRQALVPDHPDRLELDTSELAPVEAAQRILDHLATVAPVSPAG